MPSTGAARFSWEYDEGRQRLLDLYQRGKDKQWDATKRIDWDLPVDPCNVMATSEELNPIYGSRQWEVLSQAERDELGLHLGSWLFSQFLHGEQGALTVAARIVESVPDMDSKFYAATQAMDEARHVELYHRFIRDKIGLYYPINTDLAKLLADALERLPLGHALPRHAGADRGAGAGGVRGAPRPHRQRPGETGARVRHAGRGPARGVRAAGAARLLRAADLTPSAPTARSSWSRAAT